MSGVSLYEGEVRVEFDPAKHSYVVESPEYSGPVPSITSVLKVVSKGDALTQWAANCAAEYFRNAIRPGAALDEVQIAKMAEEARFAFRGKSREACDIGTIVHKYIQDYLCGRNPAMPVEERSARCCEMAVAWIRETKFTPIDVERIVYSRKYRYAGTLDSAGAFVVGGRPCLVDWKTSKYIYPEYRFQTAAYAKALSEMSGERIAHRYIVRLGKDGGFDLLSLPASDIKEDFGAFLAAKALYERLSKIKEDKNDSTGRY